MALYVCAETGLRLIAAQVQSPTVHGYFTVQTEAFDDYGCPHTLEHLIFLGSERYPYKGVLDVLANRCFAQGTNAWTATDHTCYTVDTAGSAGFLRILPVYLDHVLFPTLKDSGFVTEVHHVTGEGTDAGVVYCEMQARESEAGDMCDRAMRLAAYPGRCSYKSETGGRLKELRELTNATVVDYHRSYYRPDNLCVIVTGQVGFKDLCDAAAPVIESIRRSERCQTLAPLERPFSSPVPRPSEHHEGRIEFPAEDEKNGAICELCWHGPRWEDLEAVTALKVLLAYLCQDSVSPLRKALVETLPPLCGKISEGLHEYSTQLINITLQSCDVEQLSARSVTAEVLQVFKTLSVADGSGIDLARMRSVIGQKQRRHLSSVESNPHELFCGEIVAAFLYAPEFAPEARGKPQSGDSLRARLDAPACLNRLLDWPVERWAKLCDTFLGPSTSPGVTIVGLPSKACGEIIQSTEAARTAAQKESLGETGCAAAGEAVAAAEAENDVDTPDEVAQQFQIPDVTSVQLVSVSTVTAASGVFKAVHGKDAAQLKTTIEGFAGAGLPAPHFQFDHCAGAQFVTCNMLLPLEGLSVRQLELLPLWCDVAFELPLGSSSLGPSMDFEAVVQALTDTTVGQSFSLGVGGSRFSVGHAGNMVHLSIKVENSRYTAGPLWLGRILADAQFDVERLRISTKRVLNAVPDSKRNGRGLMALALRAMNYRDGAAHGVSNVFRVEKTLNDLLDSLEQAATELAELRSTLLESPSSMRVRVAGDLSVLGDVFAPWRQGPFMALTSTPEVEPALLHELLDPDALRPKDGQTRGCLLSSSAEESNYWIVQCNSFSDPRSPELAPLLVAIEYVTALEGPFWRKIRGKGLSYSYSMSHTLESGTLKFGLSKATNPIEAFKVAGVIVAALCTESPQSDLDEGGVYEDEEEDEVLDQTAVEAAQSGVIFGLIEKVDSIPCAMGEAWTNSLERQPPDQLQWLLQEVQRVTEKSLRAALRAHILPLFSGSCGRVVSIVCPAQKREELEAGLATLVPPFEVTHFDVDSLVSTVSSNNGFSEVRSRVRAAAWRV